MLWSQTANALEHTYEESIGELESVGGGRDIGCWLQQEWRFSIAEGQKQVGC